MGWACCSCGLLFARGGNYRELSTASVAAGRIARALRRGTVAVAFAVARGHPGAAACARLHALDGLDVCRRAGLVRPRHDRDLGATSTDLARQDTILSPRFYTTDFDAMDRLNVDLVRREWDAVIYDLRADFNRKHFVKTVEFAKRP